MPHLCPFTVHFGGFEDVFSSITDKSANLCRGKTEVADFVSFKGSIVQDLFLIFHPKLTKAEIIIGILNWVSKEVEMNPKNNMKNSKNEIDKFSFL